MIDPKEIINREEIPVTLNSDEAEALMEAIISYVQRGLATPFQVKHLYAFLQKLGPGIHEKAEKQDRLMRDKLN